MTLKQKITAVLQTQDLRQIIVFCCIGVFNTGLCFGLIVFFTLAMNLHHTLANALGYALSLAIGFTLHSVITFSNIPDQHPLLLRFKRFMTVFITAYVVQFMGLLAMIDLWHWPEIFSQLIACGIYVVLSYLGSRYYTFQSAIKK